MTTTFVVAMSETKSSSATVQGNTAKAAPLPRASSSSSSVAKGRQLQAEDIIASRKGKKKKKVKDNFTPQPTLNPTPNPTPTPAPMLVATPAPTLVDDECIGEIVNLDNDVLVEFVGRPENVQPQELILIQQEFVSTYNALVQCTGGGFRQIDTAIVDVSVIEDGRRLRDLQIVENPNTNITNAISARAFVFRMRIRGRCRGCVNNRNLFDQGSLTIPMTTTPGGGRRELTTQTSSSSSSTKSRVKGQGTLLSQHRLLKKSKNDNDDDKQDTVQPTPFPTPFPSPSPTTAAPVTSPPPLLPCPDCNGPDLASFTQAYSMAIQSLAASMRLTSIDSVNRVVELEDLECDPAVSEFESTVLVDMVGVVGEEIAPPQLVALERGFVETYNAVNALNPDTCDVFFREVTEVEIVPDQQATLNRRRLEEEEDDMGNTTTTVLLRSLVFLFRVRGRCRGCRRDANLFDEGVPMMRSLVLSAGPFATIQHDGVGVRRLQTVEDDCVCPNGPSVEFRPPTIEEFISAYNVTVQVLNARSEVRFVEQIGGATEVDPIECSRDIATFETDIQLSVVGDPDQVSEAEIVAFEGAYTETYNNLTEMYCDPLFRTIVDTMVVEIVEEAVPPPERRLQITVDPNATAPILLRPYVFLLRIRGRCRGCRRDANLFDEVLRRLQSVASTALGGVRRLEQEQQPSDTCFCVTNPLGFRAPTIDEFQVALNQTIIELGLPNIVAVTGLVELEPSPTALPSPPPSLLPTFNPSSRIEEEEPLFPTEGPSTLAPTMDPTSPPSPSPTTLAPSPNPTTLAPSASPTTLAPTASPTTLAPSASPTTLAPSASPTTLAPSASPTTLVPSASPTTLAPSASPTTLVPSPSPTTLVPSPSPTTLSPSFRPTTVSPTFSPSVVQSDNPSSAPTSPSQTPTSSPAPSPGPSSTPTNPEPSSQPTQSPKPSPSPSIAPTKSLAPTPKPTFGTPTASPAPTSPTFEPTTSPAPSPEPSASPTVPLPSVTPTDSQAPSPSPTGNTPTDFPTVSPAPSHSPTGSPVPTPSPSAAPTVSKSSVPTTSQKPTSGPTGTQVPTPSPSTAPSATDGPTISSQVPSISPTLSNEPSISGVPSASKQPSSRPSGSIVPSMSSMPSVSPSESVAPSVSDRPTSTARPTSHGQLPTVGHGPPVTLPPVASMPSGNGDAGNRKLEAAFDLYKSIFGAMSQSDYHVLHLTAWRGTEGEFAVYRQGRDEERKVSLRISAVVAGLNDFVKEDETVEIPQDIDASLVTGQLSGRDIVGIVVGSKTSKADATLLVLDEPKSFGPTWLASPRRDVAKQWCPSPVSPASSKDNCGANDSCKASVESEFDGKALAAKIEHQKYEENVFANTRTIWMSISLDVIKGYLGCVAADDISGSDTKNETSLDSCVRQVVLDALEDESESRAPIDYEYKDALLQHNNHLVSLCTEKQAATKLCC